VTCTNCLMLFRITATRANDWRSWHLLLYTSMLRIYLNEVCLTLCLTCKMCFYIIKSRNHKNWTWRMRNNLMIFIAMFEALYGKNAMRFNVYMLLHANVHENVGVLCGQHQHFRSKVIVTFFWNVLPTDQKVLNNK